MKLNLGAGNLPKLGYINLDMADIPGIDVVWNLDVAPWPFDDSSIEAIEAKDIFEHVTDPILFMTECHRILLPFNFNWIPTSAVYPVIAEPPLLGESPGSLHIRTPHYQCIDAFTDPTHKRFPTQYTFDYWIPGTIYYESHNSAYGGVAFRRLYMNVQNGTIDVTLLKIG